ncbi:MAG: hypothetical protein V4577_07175 [Bacteroidota bacterium]
MKQLNSPSSFFLIIIACVFSCYSGNALAQKTFDCSKLLRQNIVPEKPQDVIDNFNNHAGCFGLDSVDLRIFNNGPSLGSLMVRKAQSGKKNITYAEISSDINKMKKDTAYAPMRNLVTAQMTLEKRSFSPDNWDNSLKYLQVVGIPDSDVEAFHKYALEKKEHHWTYRQLIVGYRMKKESEKPVKQ